jgi:hypothetical protein
MPPYYRNAREFVFAIFAAVAKSPQIKTYSFETIRDAELYAEHIGNRFISRVGTEVRFFTEDHRSVQFRERALNARTVKKGTEWAAICRNSFTITQELGDTPLMFIEWVSYVWDLHGDGFPPASRIAPPVLKKIDEANETPQQKLTTACLAICCDGIVGGEDGAAVIQICQSETAYVSLMTRVSVKYQTDPQVRSNKLRLLACAFDVFKAETAGVASREKRDAALMAENERAMQEFLANKQLLAEQQYRFESLRVCVATHFAEFVSIN